MIVPRDRDEESGAPVTMLVRWGPTLGFLLMFAVQTLSFSNWLSGIRTDVDTLLKADKDRRENPSQWDIQFRVEIETMKIKLTEIAGKLGELDRGGTQSVRVLEQRVKQDEVELTSLNSRCVDTRSLIDATNRDLIKLQVRFDSLMEYLIPHLSDKSDDKPALPPTPPAKRR